MVGIPKTIDNDIPLVDRTFGFNTAVGLAEDAVRAAYFEASSAAGGIGLVKLMGRHSGFIAAAAALANRNVNLVLVPEVPFELEGPCGLFNYLEERFRKRKFTVIVVAEGAGQGLLEAEKAEDASGNVKLSEILKEQRSAEERADARREKDEKKKKMSPQLREAIEILADLVAQEGTLVKR